MLFLHLLAEEHKLGANNKSREKKETQVHHGGVWPSPSQFVTTC